MALNTLLSLERPTTKALAYSEWSTPPNVVIEPIKIEEENIVSNTL
jgi:hypothetical protein